VRWLPMSWMSVRINFCITGVGHLHMISDSLLVAFDNSPMFLSSSEYVFLLSPCIVVYAYYDLSVILK
jgi:hypothetical protein